MERKAVERQKRNEVEEGRKARRKKERRERTLIFFL